MFIKKGFQNANILAVILFIFGATICSAQIAGNYAKAEKDTADVKISISFVTRTVAYDALKSSSIKNFKYFLIGRKQNRFLVKNHK